MSDADPDEIKRLKTELDKVQRELAGLEDNQNPDDKKEALGPLQRIKDFVEAPYGFQTGRIFRANSPSQQARGASYNLLLLLRKDCLFCRQSKCYGPPSPSISLESIKSFCGTHRRR